MEFLILWPLKLPCSFGHFICFGSWTIHDLNTIAKNFCWLPAVILWKISLKFMPTDFGSSR